MIREIGAGLGAAVLAAVSVVALRMALATALPPATTPPAPPRVRAPMQQVVCPQRPLEAQSYLADIEREIRLLQAEQLGLQSRSDLLGQPLPADLPDAVQPDTVAALVEDLLPDGAEVLWACDAVPCSGIVVLDRTDDGALAELEALAAAIDAAYPGATSSPWQVDGSGYVDIDAEPVATVVSFQVVPELAGAHSARMYWLERWATKKPFQALQNHISEDH